MTPPRPRAARALAVVAFVAVLAASLVARAQHRPGDGTMPTPDVPPGPATIRGQVVHPTRSDATAGLEVALYALTDTGMPALRKTTTGPDGRFAFENISNEPVITYLVGARYGEVPFPGERVQFAPGELEHQVEIRVADATRDARDVSVAETRLRVERTADALSVTETHRLRNAGSTVVYASKTEREAGAKPAFRSALPTGAHDLAHPMGLVPEGLSLDGNDLAFFGPVYPGEQELSFSYELPLAGGAPVLTKRFPSGASRLVVLTPKSGITLRGDGFVTGADTTEQGRPFVTLEAKDVAAGRAVALQLDVPATRADPAAVQVEEARLFVELDDTTLVAREEYVVHVDGETPVLGRVDLPLLVIPLPPGAEELRFATDSAGYGLTPDPRGLVVLGPLAPGTASIDIAYRLPAAASPVVFDRSFAKALPLLSIYIADNGLVPASERLHRRRPVRGEESTYVHLEAFDVEAGENVPLRIERVPHTGGVSHGLAVALVLAAAAGAAAYLSGPLLRPGAATGDAEELPAVLSEREAIYASLHDLDDDLATGKLSQADYEGMRAELRRRAVELLQAERDAAPTAPRPGARGALPATPRCDACGSEARAGDRFCGRCGARLEAAQPA